MKLPKYCPCCGLLFEQGHLGSCARGPNCWEGLGATLEALRRITRRTLATGQLEKLEDARPYLEGRP